MVAKSKRPPPMLDMDEEPETSSLPIGEAFLGNTNESSDKAALHSSDPDQDGSAAPVDKDSYQNFVTPIVWGAAEHRSEIQPAKTVSGTHGFLGDDNEELVDSSCVPGTVEVEETSIATLPYSDAVRQNCEDEESAALSARRSPNGSSAEDMHEPSVKHPTPAYRKRALQMRTMALAVEVNEGTGEDASYSSLAGTGGGHATSCSRRTASLQVDQLLKGLPLATVLMINRLVVKFQAHIRGVLARRNAWRLRKRSTRLDQLGAPSSAAWPASDEIATFCEATQITEDSCRGNKIHVVDGKVSVSHNSGLELAVTRAGPRAEGLGARGKTNPQHWRTSDTCAGYLQLRARDKMDLSGLARYVCLDFGHADGSCDVDLAEHDIPHAFLHLTLRAKALANKDGPFDTSDPFYTISRIDDAGSLAEEPVVVFVSTVIQDNLNPTWPRARIPLESLTKGLSVNSRTRCDLLFQVWDKDTTTSDDLIGMARCNLMDIVTGLELPLLSPAIDQAVPTADAPGATRTTSDGKEHGRLVIEKQSVEFRYFTIGSKIKPALLRYYVEQVWRLPAPEVVISIASACGQQGGYGLDTAIEDKVLFDLMDMTNTMKAWLITNGACNSFAARVGLYRAKYAVTTPLIGISNISAWHMKEQQLREDGAAAPAGGDAHGESGRSLTGHFGQRGWMRFVGSCLDPHHSHFLLAANADRQGRQQTKLRSDFEACVRRGKGWAGLRDYIHRSLREHDLTWTDSGPDLASAAGGIEYSKSDAEGSTAQGAAGSSADAPVVMVCVQGDHAVIRTMLTHTVHEALPVLLVRGTGRATDLVADCVCLKFPHAHSMSFQRVGARQGLLPQQVVLRDYVDAMRSRLQQALPLLPTYAATDALRGDNQPEIEARRQQYAGIIQLLKHIHVLDEATQAAVERESCAVLVAYQLAVDEGQQAHLEMRHVLTVAKTRFCWVYDVADVAAPVATAPTIASDVHGGGAARLATAIAEGRERATDFHGALLHCLVNGLEHAHAMRMPGHQTHESELIQTQLVLALRWKRADVLHWLLRSAARRLPRFEFQTIADRLLHQALLTRNEAATRKLLDYGANMEAYRFSLEGNEHHREPLSTSADRQSDASFRSQRSMAADEQKQRAARLWEELLCASKTEPVTRHVYTLLSLTKKAFRARARLPGWRAACWRGLGEHREEQRADAEEGGSGGSDLARLKGWQAFANLEWRQVRAGMSATELEELSADEVEDCKKRLKTWQRLVLLHSVYGELMGNRFTYHLGISDAPALDLMLWFTLCNLPDMALIFWTHCQNPLMAAVLAAFVLKQMVKHPSIQHNNEVASSMHMAAKRFEALAMNVYRAGAATDQSMALAALEQPMTLWPGYKLLDLSYKAGCLDFLSECCAHAIDRRFAGDLAPAQQPIELVGGISFMLSLDMAVCLMILSSGGLLAPLLLSYQAPPRYSLFRHATQRRVCPPGFPFEPFGNKTMAALMRRDKPVAKQDTLDTDFATTSRRGGAKRARDLMEKLKREEGGKRAGEESLLGMLWAPTFGYTERLLCFYRAPVTLFWLSALYRTAVAGISLSYLIELQDQIFQATHQGGAGFDKYDRKLHAILEGTAASGTSGGTKTDPCVKYWGTGRDLCLKYLEGNPFFNATAGSDDIARLEQLTAWSWADWMQMVLAWHYCCELALLVVRFVVRERGDREFVNSPWPLFDVTGSLCFMAAFLLKYYTGRVDDFYRLVRWALALPPADLPDGFHYILQHHVGQVFLLQGLSAALLVARLIRVLSVNKKFGRFVMIYLSMFSALKHGIIIACLLWMAFTAFSVGITMLCQTYPEYLLGSLAFEDGMSCSDSWFNAMAFLFNTKADWSYDGQVTEVWVLYMIIFCLFNVVLINLFIALMSSKFAEVSKNADHTWTIDHYRVTKEYSSVALACISPLVSLPLFLVDLALFCWHFRGLCVLYPAQRHGHPSKMTLLRLHLMRSNAHAADLEYAGWLSGVRTRVITTSDIREGAKLQCFLENARRQLLKAFPGSRYITLEDIPVLD